MYETFNIKFNTTSKLAPHIISNGQNINICHSTPLRTQSKVVGLIAADEVNGIIEESELRAFAKAVYYHHHYRNALLFQQMIIKVKSSDYYIHDVFIVYSTNVPVEI